MLISSMSASAMASDSVFTVKTQLLYPANGTSNIESFMENAKAIRVLSTLSKDNFTVKSIKINGWASPEGSAVYNKTISAKRAATIERILKNRYDFPNEVYSVEGKGEQWDNIYGLVNSEDQIIEKYREKFSAALDIENMDARETAMKKIGNGELWRYLLKNVFPASRYADCEVEFNYDKIDEADAKELGIEIKPEPVPEPVVEPEPVKEPEPEPEPVVVEQPAPEPVVEPEPVKEPSWILSLACGPQVYWADHERSMNYDDRIHFGAMVNIEKWFNGYVGMGVGFNFYRMGGLYPGSNDEAYWKESGRGVYTTRGAEKFYQQHSWIYNPYIYAITNLINDFGGVKAGGRIYNLYISAGVGAALSHHASYSLNGSIINSFRLCKNIDFRILLNGGAMNDNFDGEVGGHRLDGTYSVMGGFGIHF